VLGKIDRGGELDDLLGTRDRSDASLLSVVYERFGWGGFLRLSGAFAAAIAGEELVLVRSPGFGAEAAIYWWEAPDGLHFSAEMPRREIDPDRIRRWLIDGLWLERSSTWAREVHQLEPGSVLIESRSGRRIEKYWTFTPFGVPRLLAEEEAQREVELLLLRSIDGEVIAEPPASELFGGSSERRRDFSEKALADVYRAIEWPVALSEAAEIAVLMRSDRPLLIDLGMREVLGATETAMGAYVESVSAAISASPKPSTLVGVLRAARPIDRGLLRSRLVPSLVDHARGVGQRWKRHLPPAIAERISIGEPADSSVDPVTGDRWVDRRFAETLDPGLAARHRALAKVRRVVAPFLDLRLVELLFSLPKAHFIRDGRIMRAVRGGVPLHAYAPPKIPSYPDDHPFRAAPRRWFYDLEMATDEDRWLGLGAFLAAFDARG
jgi:hypothetical protein